MKYNKLLLKKSNNFVQFFFYKLDSISLASNIVLFFDCKSKTVIMHDIKFPVT